MPLYEYACQDCAHRFEIRQGIRDESLTICPSCGGPIRRVVQPVGIVFKGSGFYKNDSRSARETSTPTAERSAAEATATAAERKGEKSETGATPSDSSTVSSPTPSVAPASGDSATKPSTKSASPA